MEDTLPEIHSSPLKIGILPQKETRKYANPPFGTVRTDRTVGFSKGSPLKISGWNPEKQPFEEEHHLNQRKFQLWIFKGGKKPSPFLQSMHLLGWRLDFYRFFGSNNFQVKLETGNLSFWRDIFCHNYFQGRTIMRCRSPTFWGLERRGWFWVEFTVSFLKNRHMTYDILSYDLNASTSYFSPQSSTSWAWHPFGRTLFRAKRSEQWVDS